SVSSSTGSKSNDFETLSDGATDASAACVPEVATTSTVKSAARFPLFDSSTMTSPASQEIWATASGMACSTIVVVVVVSGVGGTVVVVVVGRGTVVVGVGSVVVVVGGTVVVVVGGNVVVVVGGTVVVVVGNEGSSGLSCSRPRATIGNEIASTITDSRADTLSFAR